MRTDTVIRYEWLVIKGRLRTQWRLKWGGIFEENVKTMKVNPALPNSDIDCWSFKFRSKRLNIKCSEFVFSCIMWRVVGNYMGDDNTR
jgi:hypothetical protein